MRGRSRGGSRCLRCLLCHLRPGPRPSNAGSWRFLTRRHRSSFLPAGEKEEEEEEEEAPFSLFSCVWVSPEEYHVWSAWFCCGYMFIRQSYGLWNFHRFSTRTWTPDPRSILLPALFSPRSWQLVVRCRLWSTGLWRNDFGILFTYSALLARFDNAYMNMR